MALRRAYRPDRRNNRRRAAQRNAGVEGEAYGGPNLGPCSLCPDALRIAQQGFGIEPVGVDEHGDPADADVPWDDQEFGLGGAMKAHRNAPLFLVPMMLCACQYQRYQSDFGGAAVEDRQFLTLFWIFLGVCAFVYVLVVGFLIGGMVRQSRASEAKVVETGRHHESHPLMRSTFIGWAALIGAGLVGLAIASFFADRSMAEAARNAKLSVKVTGNQWWWISPTIRATPRKCCGRRMSFT